MLISPARHDNRVAHGPHLNPIALEHFGGSPTTSLYTSPDLQVKYSAMHTSSLLSKWLPWLVLLVAIAKLGEMIWLKRTGLRERPAPSNWVIGLMAVAIALAVTAVVYQLCYGK